MALTPQEREYLQSILAKEETAESGTAAMAEIIAGLQTRSAAQVPGRWQNHATNKEKD